MVCSVFVVSQTLVQVSEWFALLLHSVQDQPFSTRGQKQGPLRQGEAAADWISWDAVLVLAAVLCHSHKSAAA